MTENRPRTMVKSMCFQ